MKKSVQLLTAATFLTLSFSALANPLIGGGGSFNQSSSGDSIRADITVLNNTVTAEASNSSAHSYLVLKSSNTTVSRLKGKGQLSSLDQDKTEKKETVIGQDVQGYIQITLKDAGNNRITSITDSNLSASDDESDLKMDIDYVLTSDAIVVKGSWADYLKGKEIEFQLTKTSAMEQSKVTGKKLEASLEAAMKNAMAGVTIESDVTVVDIDATSQQEVCRATLKKMECFKAKSQVTIDMKVYGL